MRRAPKRAAGDAAQRTLDSFLAPGAKSARTSTSPAAAPTSTAAAVAEPPPPPPPPPASWADLAAVMPLLRSLAEPSWQEALSGEVQKPYFRDLCRFVEQEYAQTSSSSSSSSGGGAVFPPRAEVFAALNRTPVGRVRVVLLGQDPYHQPGQAQGLSFSVARGQTVPPSLRRIYEELERDVDASVAVPPTRFVRPKHGCLEAWADRGVLLLNTALTVRQDRPNSHAKCGWAQFTAAVLRVVADRCRDVVYLLWGAHAQKAASFVDPGVNCVLKCAHPSPLSRDLWLNNGHFSAANRYLREHGLQPVDWTLPP